MEKMFIAPSKNRQTCVLQRKRSEFHVVQNIAPLEIHTNMILSDGLLSVYDIDALWQILSIATLAGKGVD